MFLITYIFFSCRIVSIQLMTHMFMLAYYLINKFYLLEEKMYRHKMSWLLVVSTCSQCLCGQDGKIIHTIHIFFLRLLTRFFKGERYHLQDFRHRGQPNGREEVFNCAHSSPCNVIERSFGVWNRGGEFYKTCMLIHIKTQVEIIVVSMTLYSYIRRRSQDYEVFAEYDRNPNFILDYFLPQIIACSDSQRSQRPSHMDFIHDGITNSLMG